MRQRAPLFILILYAVGQLGWSLATYAAGNLLVYFYMPPETGTSGFPTYIHQGAVLGVFTLIGILSAGGRLLDAFIDPFIANWSDRKQSKWGKRRWFLLFGALPLALMGYMVFTPPAASENASNFIYLALVIGLYYFFFAFYVIPYTALIPELGHAPEDRLLISTLISITWALGFMLGNTAIPIQGYFESQGQAPEDALQNAVLLLQGLAFVFMLIPALFVNENRFARQKSQEHGVWQSLKIVFGLRNFRLFLISDFLYWLALTFIQLGIVYYVMVLMRLPKESAATFLAIGFIASFALYLPINWLTKKWGKKRLIMLAFGLFAIIFGAVAALRFIPVSGRSIIMVLGVAAAFPLAVFGILPNAVIGDMVEQEERETGRQMAGMFYGIRAFSMKLGISMANLLFPSLLLLGKSTDHPEGVQATAIFALIFCILGAVTYQRIKD